jgi:hypothetical protein
MRRTIGFIALWLAAGVAATTVAWLGVSTVSDQLGGSQSHPDPLSADEIAAELAVAPPTTTELEAEPVDGTATTTRPPVSSTTTTTVPAESPPTTQPSDAQPLIRSYDLVGGDVTFRFSPGGVSVVVATPASGFTTEIDSSHGGGAQVEFESDGHKSRIDAWWDDGPQTEVREDPEN